MEKMNIGRKTFLLALCFCVMWCGGCFTKKPATVHMTGIVLAHPLTPNGMANGSLGDAPDLEVESVEMPPRLAPPRGAPVKPHVAVAPPAEPQPVEEKAAEPMILPDLTADQLNAAKAETQQSLDAAESKLGRTQGKQLNATEEDVASKVRGFMESAREAMKNGDWVRAKNQAKKAEVLAMQLTGNQ
ncbi:MAG TPA: hypothetical protein VGF61_15425 [Candidatus Acidoferrum sp.]|jgi:hypothetical protein